MTWTRTRSLLLLVMAAGAVACSRTEGPTEAPPIQPSLLGETITTLEGGISALLLNCRPLPNQVVQQTVTTAGATIDIGPHRLVIPAGAVRDPVTITAEILSERVNSIRFQPEGFRFDTSTQLTMSYANCKPLLAPKKIVYTTDLLKILEVLTSRDDYRARTVTAPVDHFSRYAIAW